MRMRILICLLIISSGSVALAAAPPASTPTPAQIHEAINRVVSEPAFNHSNKSAVLGANAVAEASRVASNALTATWKYIQRVYRFLKNLFRQAVHPTMKAGLTSNILVALMISALVLLGGYFVYSLVRMWLTSRQAKIASPLDLIFEDANEPLVIEPDKWFDEAGRYASNGQFREANRALYVALLMKLHIANILVLQRYKTNGEYVQEVRDRLSDTNVNLFVAITRDFEAAWYGDEPVTAHKYQTQFDDATRLITQCCTEETVQ